ncbi:MAG TPA: RdgB/HAM1 family non-canonical purine NTP pyrophosphatase [Candidatus Acidoferrales bacterium]|nr:RdgB/HAM1 family non-canonical purine NTP pyrophosphatase [Candidatus Acidoferrales bacterium]
MRVKLLAASSNQGKLREFRALAAEYAGDIEIDLLPRFSELAVFPEDEPTFAENAAGKALHYSRFTDEIIFADDSGLVVASLGGAPGVRSARYAGENAADQERNAKLLAALRGKTGDARNAKFVCIIAAARKGKMLAVVSDSVEGTIANEPSGANGFGYDPLFYFSLLKKTFAELTEPEKNRLSHRGKAFRKLGKALSMTS